MEAAEEAGAYTPMGGEAEELYQRFVDRGGGHKDFSAIIKMIDDSWTAARQVNRSTMHRSLLTAATLICSRAAAKIPSSRNVASMLRPAGRAPAPLAAPLCSKQAALRSDARAPRRHGRRSATPIKAPAPRNQARTRQTCRRPRSRRRPSAARSASRRAGSRRAPARMSARPAPRRKSGRSRQISPPRCATSRRRCASLQRRRAAATCGAIKARYARPRQDLQGLPRHLSCSKMKH